jgi:hypothetical protein
MLLVAVVVRSSDRGAVARLVVADPLAEEADRLGVGAHLEVEEALAVEVFRITTLDLAAAVGSKDYWRSSESVASGL